MLARLLDTGSMRGFFPRHEFYLTLSTVQWAINLALLAVSVVLWDHRPVAEGEGRPGS